MKSVLLVLACGMVMADAAVAGPGEDVVVPVPLPRLERPFIEGEIPVPRWRPERPLKHGWEALERDDYTEAIRWYRKAADQGLADAQYILGLLYVAGEGVPRDSAEAVKWFRKAAEQGRANAQFAVGTGYASGDGVPQDFVLAHMWYDLSAAQSYELAGEYRDEIAKRMSQEQITEARRLAGEWKPVSER